MRDDDTVVNILSKDEMVEQLQDTAISILKNAKELIGDKVTYEDITISFTIKRMPTEDVVVNVNKNFGTGGRGKHAK